MAGLVSKLVETAKFHSPVNALFFYPPNPPISCLNPNILDESGLLTLCPDLESMIRPSVPFKLDGPHKLYLPRDPQEEPLSMVLYVYDSARDEDDAEWLMIYSHGNADSIDLFEACTDVMKKWSQKFKAHILLYEYSGYGWSSRSANERNINADITAAHYFATQVLGWPSDRIMLIGQSIGTGPSCHLAAKLEKVKMPLGGLILVSPFTSLRSVARHVVKGELEDLQILKDYGIEKFFGRLGNFIVKNFMIQRWASADIMPSIKCFVLLLHGEDDTLIPSGHSVILHEMCGADGSRKYFNELRGEGHDLDLHNLAGAIQVFLMDRKRELEKDDECVKVGNLPKKLRREDFAAFMHEPEQVLQRQRDYVAAAMARLQGTAPTTRQRFQAWAAQYYLQYVLLGALVYAGIYATLL